MTLSKRTREQMLALCGEIHEDDGVDPREFFKAKRPREKRNRKAIQLCSQVAETVGLALAGEFADELLQNLQVVSVDPAPDASHLAVAVRVDASDGQVDPQDVLDRLHAVAGQLRCLVAAAITRKRAPRLEFHIVGPGAAAEVQQ